MAGHQADLWTKAHCGESSIASTRITDLGFAGDALILCRVAGNEAFEVLHKDAKPLGLQVSWDVIKVYVFGGLLDETVQQVNECAEYIKVLETLTCLRSVVHSSGGSCLEVFGLIGLTSTVTDLLYTTFGAAGICAGQKYEPSG